MNRLILYNLSMEFIAWPNTFMTVSCYVSDNVMRNRWKDKISPSINIKIVILTDGSRGGNT
jgi:hypothetical protein